MSFKGSIEDKSAEAPVIPDMYVKEYAKFCRLVETETDLEVFAQGQVKFNQMLRAMASAKVYIPPSWADTANEAVRKSGEIRLAEFARRTR